MLGVGTKNNVAMLNLLMRSHHDNSELIDLNKETKYLKRFFYSEYKIFTKK